MNVYPLKFHPRFVPKMWGGRKLASVLGKSIPPGSIGESWELYDFPPGVVDNSSGWISSVIANGPLAGRTLHEAVADLGAALYGQVPLVGPHGQFPILIKFLDAREDLSVQVHPDQAYAGANPHAHLKSEAWYVLQRDPGARLLNGLVPGTTRPSFESALRGGHVDRLIRSIPVHEGDCYYLPSGTVHALGAGILAAEVQTPSDTTFRVFDFNRIDPSTGRPRALHVAEALQCIDFEPSNPDDLGPDDTDGRLVTCPYFHVDRGTLEPDGERQVAGGMPRVMIVLAGALQLTGDRNAPTVPARRGEVILIPAGLRDLFVRAATDDAHAAAAWLEVTFPAERPLT